MLSHDEIQLNQFLRDFPSMVIRPSNAGSLRLMGNFAFSANHSLYGHVQDAFDVEIIVPATFPRSLPVVKEKGGRIPRTGDFHINSDETLCLGSDLRLLMRINKTPTLPGFATHCLVPYLYAISLKLKSGGKLVFGELAHGRPGMLKDYAELFDLLTPKQAQYALQLLGMKRRIANKFPCPCGCKFRLGRCNYHYRLLPFRRLANRSWFREQARRAS